MNSVIDHSNYILSRKLVHTSDGSLNKGYLDRLARFLQETKYERVILPPLSIGSSQCQELIDWVFSCGKKPCLVMTPEDFIGPHDIQQYINDSVECAIQIYKPLSASFLNIISRFKNSMNQFHFILMARKDWNYINTFKSIPYFMRENIYIDFPIALTGHEPFYVSSEIDKQVDEMKKNFIHFEMKSFAPHYQIYQEFLKFRPTGFSVPVEGVASKKFSLLAFSMEDLKKVPQLVLDRDDIEILLARCSHRKIQDISDLDLNLVRKIWLHSEKLGSIEEEQGYLENFAVQEAQSEKIIFLRDLEGQKVLGSLEDVDKVIQRSEFLSQGGVDILGHVLKNSPIMTFRQAAGAEDHRVYNNESTQNAFVDEEFVYKYERMKDLYLNLYKSTPKVAVEGHIKFLWSWLKPLVLKIYYVFHSFYFKFLHKGYYKFLHTGFHRFYLFLNNTYYQWLRPPVISTYLAFNRIYHDFIKKIFVSLFMGLNEFYYKYPHQFYYAVIHKAYYRIHDFYYKYVFRLLFPVRKVYYFARYQYEKRVLGLHKKEEDTQ